MTIYLVTGSGIYMDTKPGHTFVAELDREQEDRAIKRGAIQVVDRRPCRVDETRVRMPRGHSNRGD